MTTPTEILRDMEPERFTEVFSSSPRKIREEILRRLGIKTKKKSSAFALKTGGKDDRAQKLQDHLKNGREINEDVLDELIRNYLYTRRSLLADALDHFGIENDDGLTDAEIDFLEELEPEKGRALKKVLVEKDHAPADIELYLAYMKIPS